ncbi:glycosyltransferase [Cyanobium sp. NIES-981]|uniref:glycosyltransferase family protein n=1 Tax=Cyanobium sp. NIES-981 TaxID=1851505 RepID=UPI0007DD45E9|nr:glycosyltransferase [Cyanobium sp. NIES-981]SBO44587.1 putative Glycosyl transferase, family 2 [Cyanobium sp. NIES-981]
MRQLDLLVAAPSDPAGFAGWGDVAFAQSLQRAFRSFGVATRLLFRDTYTTAPAPPPETALLVLRGKFRPLPAWLEQAPYQSLLLWQISWPLDVSRQELAAYDHLFVASAQDRQRLAYLSGRPTTVLLQATDFQQLGPPQAPCRGLLFVGNTRGVARPLVLAFARSGLPLTVIGAGWEVYGIRAERSSISNHELPDLYARSLAVLNDHHTAMRDFGYLNNRVFDVLACGVPVITDGAPGCPGELSPAVLVHGPKDDPQATLAAVHRCRDRVGLLQQLSRHVAGHHRFEHRAGEILQCCAGILNTGTSPGRG